MLRLCSSVNLLELASGVGKSQMCLHSGGAGCRASSLMSPRRHVYIHVFHLAHPSGRRWKATQVESLRHYCNQRTSEEFHHQVSISYHWQRSSCDKAYLSTIDCRELFKRIEPTETYNIIYKRKWMWVAWRCSTMALSWTVEKVQSPQRSEEPNLYFSQPSLHLGSISTISHHHIIHITQTPTSPNPNCHHHHQASPNPDLIFTTPKLQKGCQTLSVPNKDLSHPIVYASTV